MKRILITGATGLVGSACVEFFLERGWFVVALDYNMRHSFFGTPDKNVLAIPEAKDPEVHLATAKADIRDQSTISNLMESGKFDAIIHAAAQPSHDYSNDHILEDFDINARGTLVLLEATRRHCPDAVFVHVSTDKVYGENMSVFYPDMLVEMDTRYESGEGIPFKEDLGLDFAGHRSPFGVSKAAADMYAQEYAVTFGLKTGIFRPGCITGKNHDGAELHGFLAYLAKCIRTGSTYKIFGFKGKQVRDQIHANDLASAFFYFIQNPRPGEVYNIGGGPDRSVSVLEAGEMIQEASGGRFNYVFEDARPGDRQWDVHDVSKFRSHYPEWDYEYSLQDIIEDLCEKPL